MGERNNACGVLVENPEGNGAYENLGYDGWVILKFILNRVSRHGLDSSG
jgi:hypothetical protein